MIRDSSPSGWIRGACVLTAIVSLLWLTGCGRPVGSITGKVTYQGNPVKGGNISFVSTEGEPSQTSPLAEDGSYSIPRITGGEYKVVVETASLRPTPVPQPSPGKGKTKIPEQKLEANPDIPAGYRPSSPADESAIKAQAFKVKRFVAIPNQYGDSNTTDLTYTAVGGSQTHNIELK